VIASTTIVILIWCFGSQIGGIFGNPLARSVKSFAIAEENLLKVAKATGGIDAAWVPEVVSRVRVGVDVPAYYTSQTHMLASETRRRWRRWESAFTELRATLSESDNQAAELEKLSKNPDNRIQQMAKAITRW